MNLSKRCIRSENTPILFKGIEHMKFKIQVSQAGYHSFKYRWKMACCIK